MKKFLIGCGGILLLAAILVGVIVSQAPRIFERGKQMVGKAIAEEMRVGAIAADWKPPTPEVGESWFPPVVDDWKREFAEPAPGTTLDLDRAGFHARYRSVRGVIDVDVFPINEMEKATAIGRVREAVARNSEPAPKTLSSGGSSVTFHSGVSSTVITRGDRISMKFGDRHARLWWIQGYLFIFRAVDGADDEKFPESFIVVSSAQTPVPAR